MGTGVGGIGASVLLFSRGYRHEMWCSSTLQHRTLTGGGKSVVARHAFFNWPLSSCQNVRSYLTNIAQPSRSWIHPDVTRDLSFIVAGTVARTLNVNDSTWPTAARRGKPNPTLNACPITVPNVRKRAANWTPGTAVNLFPFLAPGYST